MIMDDNANVVPSIDDFSPDYLDELHDDIILDRRVRTSWRGDIEYLHVRFKGMHPKKEKWMETRKVRENYPHQFNH